MPRKFKRDGDFLIVTEVEEFPLEISYQEVFSKTEVVLDEDHHEAPWKYCDGWEHRCIKTADRLDESQSWGHWRGATWVRHYNEDDIVRVGSYDHRLILLEKEHYKPWGIYEYHRQRGCSRQVAREKEAQARREALEQLKTWYQEGWEYWGVVCNHPLMERFNLSCSVWGIDDEEYADREMRQDIALEACHDLEKLGFVITGWPSEVPTREEKQAALRSRIARNLGFQESQEYRRWLLTRRIGPVARAADCSA